MWNAFRIDIGTLVQLFSLAQNAGHHGIFRRGPPYHTGNFDLSIRAVTDNVSRGNRPIFCTGAVKASTAWILCLQGFHN